MHTLLQGSILFGKFGTLFLDIWCILVFGFLVQHCYKRRKNSWIATRTQFFLHFFSIFFFLYMTCFGAIFCYLWFFKKKKKIQRKIKKKLWMGFLFFVNFFAQKKSLQYKNVLVFRKFSKKAQKLHIRSYNVTEFEWNG